MNHRGTAHIIILMLKTKSKYKRKNNNEYKQKKITCDINKKVCVKHYYTMANDNVLDQPYYYRLCLLSSRSPFSAGEGVLLRAEVGISWSVGGGVVREAGDMLGLSVWCTSRWGGMGSSSSVNEASQNVNHQTGSVLCCWVKAYLNTIISLELVFLSLKRMKNTNHKNNTDNLH